MRALILLIFLFSCSNIEFVHKINKKNPIINSTIFSVDGDQSNLVVSELTKLLGKTKSKVFVLETKTIEKTTNEVVGSDSTTLKYKISHTISYNLKNKQKGCPIFKNKITTMTNYDSKSAGYNFGSDISKLENTKISIKNNIKKFIKLTETANLSDCLNEG